MENIDNFVKAAERGDITAQSYLGTCYYLGKGVAQDYREALKWLRLAAEQGHAFSQLQIGSSYAYGRGVLQDTTEAVKWFKLAAEQGIAVAQYNLGCLYDFGEVVVQSYQDAFKWYLLTCSNASGELLERASHNMNLSRNELSSVQIDQATKEAIVIQKHIDSMKKVI